MTRSTICVGMLLLAAGCKDRQACEQSRVELAKTWEQLKNSAGTLKYARAEESDTLSDVEKEQRAKRWSKLEERAALLESAFISQQVTWESAETARQEIATEFRSQPAQGMVVQGFGQGLEKANQAFEAFRAKCK